MDDSNYLIEKIKQGRYEDLYTILEVLAADTEKTLSAHGCTLQSCRTLSQSLSEIRSTILELIQTKSEKKLMPLFKRYLELEGKVKEMRNDLSSPTRQGN